jgi:hypothetical protein
MLPRVHRVRHGNRVLRYHRHTRTKLPDCARETEKHFVEAWRRAEEAAQMSAEKRAEIARQEEIRGFLDTERKMLSRAKHRASRKGLPCEMTRTELRQMLVAQDYTCAVSGILFDVWPLRTGWRPFSPSLDRIDCTQGYVAGNVRLVCLIVNFALNTFGDDAFLEMCRAVVKNKMGT